MGHHSDLGTGTVDSICEITGYPKNRYGQLLDPFSHKDGTPEKDWNKKGKELYNLTSPYGHLQFAVGSGDDFVCADYATINCGAMGEFIILDFTFNSETGCYIGGCGYYVLPVNSTEQKRKALNQAFYSMNCPDDVRHTRKGWNQDENYFARCVAKALFPSEFKEYSYVTIKGKKRYVDHPLFSEREMRFGGKKINKVIDKILTGE